MPLVLKFTVGAVIMGTVVIVFLAGLVYAALRKLRRNVENPLPVSCAIVVLALIGFSMYLQRQFSLYAILSNTVSGFLAFFILRLLFKKEIEDDQKKNQEITDAENGTAPK